LPYNNTGQDGTLKTDGDETHGRCIYTKFKRTIVQENGTDARLFRFDPATYDQLTSSRNNLTDCAGLCDTFLLCRMVTFTDSNCAMYGATAYGQNFEDTAVVSETNDGCRLKPLFFSPAVTKLDNLTNATRMAVKDNCCLARFPITDAAAPTSA
jgi:hypothetical protein